MPTRPSHIELGKRGERLARRALEHRGYAVLATGYRSRFGEIDIICLDGDTVVFVEVKARRTRRYGGAADAIPLWKRRRIGAMALDYLAWTGRLESACRFDVVAVDGIGTANESVRVIPGAFEFDRR